MSKPLERAGASSGGSIELTQADGVACVRRSSQVRNGFPQDVGRFADGPAEIANREFCAIFALSRGRWHSPGPRPRVNRAPRANFDRFSGESEKSLTRWRRGRHLNPRDPLGIRRRNSARVWPLFGPNKSIGAGESFFALDSALFRCFGPLRFPSFARLTREIW